MKFQPQKYDFNLNKGFFNGKNSIIFERFFIKLPYFNDKF